MGAAVHGVNRLAIAALTWIGARDGSIDLLQILEDRPEVPAAERTRRTTLAKHQVLYDPR
jgi:hypothetical protein